MVDFQLGVVSNVFGKLLPTHSLPSLLSQLRANGFSYVELRQGFLGAPFEGPAPDCIPDAYQISSLVSSFPDLAFNYAFTSPYMGAPQRAVSTSGSGSSLFAAALETAIQIARARPDLGPPMLRMSDHTSDVDFISSATLDAGDCCCCSCSARCAGAPAMGPTTPHLQIQPPTNAGASSAGGGRSCCVCRRTSEIVSCLHAMRRAIGAGGRIVVENAKIKWRRWLPAIVAAATAATPLEITKSHDCCVRNSAASVVSSSAVGTSALGSSALGSSGSEDICVGVCIDPCEEFECGADSLMNATSGHLAICYDVCNLVSASHDNDLDPVATTRSLASRGIPIAEIHCKQARCGCVLDVIAEGDIDWTAMRDALLFCVEAQPSTSTASTSATATTPVATTSATATTTAPTTVAAASAITKQNASPLFLLEISPSTDVWQRLAESRDYLQTRCGYTFC
eukprot:gnl/Spiro4/25877_TR12884_c0_g1_i1.p1 gnl/Spiro4/25877_TR12884_c0_g1~~gnl/Spiro4/25877_TR12884_c0_g1_i1.p1  ORF type:complete len:454 (+),score=51.82 gnl/Spiro4/25877_TR12884_c0_g1_i1:42-1403(+)